MNAEAAGWICRVAAYLNQTGRWADMGILGSDTMDNKQKTGVPVVVVLGAGRSGTSLAMQVLAGLGLSLSEKLIPPRYHNPYGPMEDFEIASIYDKDLLPLVGSTRLLPFPWESTELGSRISSIKANLKAVLKENIAKSSSLWGFKDPYTSSILPLWFKVFNESGVTPKFIFCTRNPSAVVVSRERSFGVAESIGELAWLSSSVSALYDSGCDVFILHYEDWFEKPSFLGTELLRFTSLDDNFKGSLDQVLTDTVHSNLNRSSFAEYEIQNPYVTKLYAALKECHGTGFNHERLMAVVKECRQAIVSFKGWYLIAQEANKQRADVQARLEKSNAEAAKVKPLENRICELEKEIKKHASLVTQLQKLQRQVEGLYGDDG